MRGYYPLSRDTFYDIKNNFDKPKSQYERAAIFYVLNRSSFSGLTLTGGMSAGHPNFNQTKIKSLADFNVKNLTVQQADFKESIPRANGELLYLDPPYLIDMNLYGNHGDMHEGFDHKGLANILKDTPNWILSYNQSPEIEELYKGFQFHYPKWSYAMSDDKESKEVLILSDDIVQKNLESPHRLDHYMCRNDE